MDSATCGNCGLKRWDADDLEPGDYVCTCDDLDDGDCWDDVEPGRPVETVDTGGLL